MSAEPIPVACTLTTAEAARQTVEWTDLHERVIAGSPIAGGARLRFPLDLREQIDDLAAREASCCAFLTITTSQSGGELVLDVTSDNPDAMPVIEMLAGIELGEGSAS